MKKLLILLVVVLGASFNLASGAVGDLHDAYLEFSGTENPQTTTGYHWSYHVGQAFGTPVNPYDTLEVTVGPGSNMWMPPAIAGAPFDRIGGGGPWDEPGLVAYPLGAHSPFMTRWTVPAGVAAVEVGLSYLQQYEPGRQMRLHIKFNGVDVVSMDSIRPLSNDYPNNGYQWTQFPTTVKKNVVAGDKFDFVVDAFGSQSGSPGTGCTSCFTSWVREIDPLTTFTLTVNTNPAGITSVTNYGVSQQAVNTPIELTATQFNGCQSDPNNHKVYAFTNWTGPVADPSAASTTITSSNNVTVTANYHLISACGDVCHPYPAHDYNQNCIVDLPDFATFAATWMNCTQPTCVD